MNSRIRFFILYLLIGAGFAFNTLHENRIVAIGDGLDGIPRQLGRWSQFSMVEFSDSILANLVPTDYTFRSYRDADGNEATLYIGYHDGSDSGPVHSPRLCLPGSGWNQVSTERTELTVAGETVPVVKSVYRKDSSLRMFIYWFRVAGDNLDNEFALKFRELTGSLLHGRKDTALIRVDIPIRGGEADALATATGFLDTFYPAIVDSLPAKEQ